MSYARLRLDCDVYVFEHVDGFICCMWCKLAPGLDNYHAATAAEMDAHLCEHEAAGHSVPAGVIGGMTDPDTSGDP